MKHYKHIWLIPALLLMLVACARESMSPESEQYSGERMSIRLSMDYQQVVTKSATIMPAENGEMRTGAPDSGQWTKTSYSGAVFSGYERIDWQIDDLIRIFTDNTSASGDKTWTGNSNQGAMSDYAVSEVTPQGSKSYATISPYNSQKDLKWGSGAHNVFGFYPSPMQSSVSVNNQGALNFNGMSLNYEAEFNASQSGGKWHFSATAPMSQAFLWAAASIASPVESMDLSFHPLFNAVELDFTRADILGTAKLPAGKSAQDFRLSAVQMTSEGKHLFAKYNVAVTKGTSWQDATFATNITNNNGKSIRYVFPDYGTAKGDLSAQDNVAGNHNYSNTRYTVRYFIPFNTYGETDGLKIRFEFVHSDNSTTFSRTLLLKRNHDVWLSLNPGEKLTLDPGNAEAPIEWEYVLEVGPVDRLNPGAANTSYSVRSYKFYVDGNSNRHEEAVPWKTQINLGSRTNENQADWRDIASYTANNNSTPGGWIIFNNTANGTGRTLSSGQWETRTVSAQDRKISITGDNPDEYHRVSLGSRLHPSGINNLFSKENAIDLSMYDITGLAQSRNTANCYVVRGPGWYKIPLVYGNGIKNGNNNVSGSASFKDHSGATITRPWIKVQTGISASAMSAELIWTDYYDITEGHTLVCDVQTEGDYLLFNVPQRSIHPGNALLAVKSGGNILWSWHIWITDQPLYADTHGYLTANIGWVDINVKNGEYRPARGEMLRVVQLEDGGAVKDFDVLQEGQDFYTSQGYELGRYTFFQYGRKDPLFPPQVNNNNRTQHIYDKNGNLITEDNGYMQRKSMSSLAETIKNPAHFCTTNIFTDTSLWGNQKTLYDPSPIGFKVLPNFDSWASSFPGKGNSYSYLRLPYSGAFRFPGGYVGADGSMFIGLCGYRDESSLLNSTPTELHDYWNAKAYYWAANGTYIGFGRDAQVITNESGIWAKSGNGNHGYGIRCVADN